MHKEILMTEKLINNQIISQEYLNLINEIKTKINAV